MCMQAHISNNRRAYTPTHTSTKSVWHLQRLPDKAARFYAGCVCMALQYLHNRDLIFRALNTENVVIHADGYAKLVDFQQAAGLVERCVAVSRIYAMSMECVCVCVCVCTQLVLSGGTDWFTVPSLCACSYMNQASSNIDANTLPCNTLCKCINMCICSCVLM